MTQGIGVTEITANIQTNGYWFATDNRVIFWYIIEEDNTYRARVYDVADDGTLSLAQEYEYTDALPSGTITAVGSSASHDWFVLAASKYTWVSGVGYVTYYNFCFIGVDKATGALTGLGGQDWNTIEIQSENLFPTGYSPESVFWSPSEEALLVFCPGYSSTVDNNNIARLGVVKIPWDPESATVGSEEIISSFDLFSIAPFASRPYIPCDPIQLANGDIIVQVAHTSLDASYLVRIAPTGVVIEVRKTDDGKAITEFANLKALSGNSFMLTYMYISTTPEYRLFSENQHLVQYEATARTYEWNGWDFLKKDEATLPIFSPRSNNRIPPPSLKYGTGELIDPLTVTGSETSGLMIQYAEADFKGAWVPHLGIPIARMFWWSWEVDSNLNLTLGSRQWLSLGNRLSEIPDKEMRTAARWYNRGRPKDYLITTYSAPDYDIVNVVLIDPKQLNV